MKGISTVLAIVLIVVITVGIIGMAYAWSVGMLESVTESGSEQVEHQVKTLGAAAKIVSIVESEGNTLIYVKNTGLTELSDFNLFLNDVKLTNVDYSLDKVKISKHEIITITLIGTISDDDYLKITTMEGATVEIVEMEVSAGIPPLPDYD